MVGLYPTEHHIHFLHPKRTAFLIGSAYLPDLVEHTVPARSNLVRYFLPDLPSRTHCNGVVCRSTTMG